MRRLAKAGALLTEERLIFLIVFLASAYFSEIAYQTSNYTARYFLTRAVVDRQTFRLDAYRADLGVDGAIYDGHLYSNKPPGSSLMMLPQYLLVGKPVQTLLKNSQALPEVRNQQYDPAEVFAGWLVQILSLALYTSIAFVYFYRILKLLGINRRTFEMTLLAYFGTLMFPYATIGTGEMYTVAPTILATYYLLHWFSKERTPALESARGLFRAPKPERDLLLAGLWLALAFFTTNQMLLVIVIAASAIVWHCRSIRSLAIFSAPIATAGLLTLAYNWVNFDSPWAFPIQYWEQGVPEVILFELPDARKLAEMLFLPWKGLFFYMPFLILAAPGFVRMQRRADTRNASTIPPAAVFFFWGSPGLYFLFLLFNVGWFGGADLGFRYFVPVLPFAAIGAVAWLSGRKTTMIEKALVVWSVSVCTFGALTDPEVPTGIRNPLVDYNWPVFRDLATNNVPNLLFDQLLEVNNWFLRMGTTLVFAFLLALLIWFARSVRATAVSDQDQPPTVPQEATRHVIGEMDDGAR